jgi:hypothetical protein
MTNFLSFCIYFEVVQEPIPVYHLLLAVSAMWMQLHSEDGLVQRASPLPNATSLMDETPAAEAEIQGLSFSSWVAGRVAVIE